MLCETCVMNAVDGCREKCDWRVCSKHTTLTDRRRVEFPVYPECFHRTQIYNSAITVKESSSLPVSFIYITDEKDPVREVEGYLRGEKPRNFTRKG